MPGTPLKRAGIRPDPCAFERKRRSGENHRCATRALRPGSRYCAHHSVVVAERLHAELVDALERETLETRRVELVVPEFDGDAGDMAPEERDAPARFLLEQLVPAGVGLRAA